MASLIDLLTPVSCGITKKRFGPAHDGGYVLLDSKFDVQAIFGYGVGHDVTLENQLSAEWDIPAYVFDHTITSVPPLGPNTQYIAEGITGGQETAELKTFSSHLNRFLPGDGRVLLKIDVEGAEWDAIERENFDRVTYFVIEYHDIESDTKRKTHLMRKIAESFDLIHVHGVNFHNQPIFMFDRATPIPRYIECTYIRKGLVETFPCNETYPTPLDMVGRPEVADVQQQFWKNTCVPVNFMVEPEHFPFVREVMTRQDSLNDPKFSGFTFRLNKGELFPYRLVYSMKNMLSDPISIYLPVVRRGVWEPENRITHPGAINTVATYDQNASIYKVE
jgi:hypothetical protein